MINLIWQPGMTLESVEREVILQAMRYFRGNKTATSTALGIAYKTLDNKLHQYKEDEQSQEKKQNERTARDEEYLKRARGIVTTTVPISAIEAAAKGTQAPESQGLRAEGQHGVESTTQLPSQQPTSVQVGKKVQEVPSKHPAGGGTSQRGKSI